jgi:4-amino-4-deoxy-L-arabinose transferase-like glycosyltransferase
VLPSLEPPAVETGRCLRSPSNGAWLNDRRRYVLLLGLIVCWGLLLRLPILTEPWDDDRLGGWSGPFYGIAARNYLRYGYLATRMAPVLNTGPASPDQFAFYTHHPPLVPLLVSLSFRIFGEHEWSARLVPLLFSLMGLFLLAMIARRVASPRLSLLATWMMASFPMAALFGTLVDVQGPILLAFALVVVYAYLRWSEAPQARWVGVMGGGFLLGALTDWPIFYLIPLLWVHNRWKNPGRAWRSALWVGLSGGLFLAALALYLSIVGGDRWLIFKALQLRSFRWMDDSGIPYSLLDWIRMVGGEVILGLFTPVGVALALGWVVAAIKRYWAGGCRRVDEVIVMLLAFGSAHIVLGFEGAYVHAIWSIYLAPGIALASAVALEGFFVHVRLPHWAKWTPYALTLIIGIYLAHATASYYASWRLPLRPDYDVALSPESFGHLVQATTQDHDRVLTSFYQKAPALWYYADRHMLASIISVDLLQRALQSGEIDAGTHRTIVVPQPPGAKSYFILPTLHAEQFPELFSYLRAHFAFVRRGNYWIFGLQNPAW